MVSSLLDKHLCPAPPQSPHLPPPPWQSLARSGAQASCSQVGPAALSPPPCQPLPCLLLIILESRFHFSGNQNRNLLSMSTCEVLAMCKSCGQTAGREMEQPEHEPVPIWCVVLGSGELAIESCPSPKSSFLCTYVVSSVNFLKFIYLFWPEQEPTGLFPNCPQQNQPRSRSELHSGLPHESQEL